MPLKRFLRRRLLSLLHPWLREQPQLNLQLGFLNSLAVAENLRFDVALLNQLFDAPSSLFLKDLTVERLVVRFSTWNSPAFTVQVHGVRVVLSFENPEDEGCVRRLRSSKFDYSDYLRNNLSVLDPEGCSLHNVLERILFTGPDSKDFTTSFLNLILKNCHLEAHHIQVEVRFPIFNDAFMCFGEIKEFSARSKYLDRKSLLRGFVSTIFIPMKESSYILNGIAFRVRFVGNNHTDRVLLSSDMHIFVELRDLKLADCTLCFPELAFSFSPDDISVFLALDKLLSDKYYNKARSARELWRIAANRIGHVTVTSRLSLQRLGGVIGQWIHYVDAYENILLLVGYSTGHIWKKSISKMSQDKLSSARYHWEVIFDIEKKLPVEGIALARRIARHRAALKVPSDCHEECMNTSAFFCPFLFILALMWKMISKIIHCLANIFCGKKIVQDPDIDSMGSLTEYPCQRCCYVLNFGKIITRVSQINEIQPSVCDKLQSHTGIAYSDFLSICVCIDALIFVSVKDIFEQRVFLSCGQMKVEPAPLTVSGEASTRNMLNTAKGNGQECITNIESILWVEPAKPFLLSGTNAVQADDSCDSNIESFMGKLSLSWKGICSTFNESEIEYAENPCLLCKVEISSTYQDQKNPDFGFCEFGLMLGKVNLVLSHSSVSSMSLLGSQIQHAICWENRREASIASYFVDKRENAWVNKYESYSKVLIVALLQKLPEKHIHFEVSADGSSVRYSHRREANLGGGEDINDSVSQDNFDLTFDFHEIEVVVGSPSLFGMAPLTGQLGLNDAKEECITLEPQVIEIPKPYNVKYACSGKISIGSYLHLNGLNACLEKSAEKHQIQIFVLKPITVQILSLRDYIYSLSTTMSAFSAALGVTAGGFTVFSFLDEVYVIYKAVTSLSSLVSYLFSSFEEVDCMHPEILKQKALFEEPDNCDATMQAALLTNNIFPFFINGTFRFKSMDVILHNSRTTDNVESHTRKFDLSTGNKLSVKKLPDCGIWISIQQTTVVIACDEGKMDFLTDLAGIMSFIFEYQNSIGSNNDHIVLENMLLRSVNCLHEISLSGCSFTLCLGPMQNTSSSGNESKTLGSSNSDGNISYLVRETNLTIFERSNNQSPCLVENVGSPTNIGMPTSASHWLQINVAVANVFIGRCSMKSDLVQAHQLNKFLSLLSVGGEFQIISWEIQVII